MFLSLWIWTQLSFLYCKNNALTNRCVTRYLSCHGFHPHFRKTHCYHMCPVQPRMGERLLPYKTTWEMANQHANNWSCNGHDALFQKYINKIKRIIKEGYFLHIFWYALEIELYSCCCFRGCLVFLLRCSGSHRHGPLARILPVYCLFDKWEKVLLAAFLAQKLACDPLGISSKCVIHYTSKCYYFIVTLVQYGCS